MLADIVVTSWLVEYRIPMLTFLDVGQLYGLLGSSGLSQVDCSMLDMIRPSCMSGYSDIRHFEVCISRSMGIFKLSRRNPIKLGSSALGYSSTLVVHGELPDLNEVAQCRLYRTNVNKTYESVLGSECESLSILDAINLVIETSRVLTNGGNSYAQL